MQIDTTLSYSSNCSIFSAKILETTSTTKKQQKLKNGKVRFRLNIDVRKEMEDSRLNAMGNSKTLTPGPRTRSVVGVRGPGISVFGLPFVKGRLNFSCKSTTVTAESLLDNWLKINHITVDKIYYLRSLFVSFYEF